MHDRLLRRQQVEEIAGLSRSSIYRQKDAGEFPPPVRVSPGAVRWRESEVMAWVRSRPVAGTESDGPRKDSGGSRGSRPRDYVQTRNGGRRQTAVPEKSHGRAT